MNNVEISVIIPVYNAEKYLEECLSSIINQTFKNLEIICVDNKSTDSSAEILERFAKLDKRIKIFSTEKKGVCLARNMGLKNACGKYIHFVDSDDKLSLNFYEKMLEKLNQTNSDIVLCKCKKFSAESNETIDYDFFADKTEKISDWPTSTIWFYMFKHELAHEFRNELIYGEDDLFSFLMFRKIKSYSISNESIYYYRTHSASTVANVDEKTSYFDRVKIIKIVNKMAKDNPALLQKDVRAFFMLINYQFCALHGFLFSNPNQILKLYMDFKVSKALFKNTEYEKEFSRILKTLFKSYRKYLIQVKFSSKEVYLKIFGNELIKLGGKNAHKRCTGV